MKYTQEQFTNLITEQEETTGSTSFTDEEKSTILNKASRKDIIEEAAASRAQKYLEEAATRKEASERRFTAADLEPDSEEKLAAEMEKSEEQVRIYDFIGPAFQNFLSFPEKSFVLIGAKTGRGKSTTVAAIAHSLLKQGLRVLIISAEEAKTDYLKRLACLELQKSFFLLKKNLMPAADRAKVMALAPKLQNVKVIDTNHNGSASFTTCVDHVIDSVKLAVGQYDAVLLDYYGKMDAHSLNTDPAAANSNQKWLGDQLDNLKDKFAGPIVLMCQLNKTADTFKDFKPKLEGRCAIANSGLLHIEMVANFSKYETTFRVHKDRWGGRYQKRFGFHRELNTYVAADNPDFLAKRQKWIDAAQEAGLEDIDEDEPTKSNESYHKAKRPQPSQEAYDQVAQAMGTDYQAGQKVQGKSVADIYAAINPRVTRTH